FLCRRTQAERTGVRQDRGTSDSSDIAGPKARGGTKGRGAAACASSPAAQLAAARHSPSRAQEQGPISEYADTTGTKAGGSPKGCGAASQLFAAGAALARIQQLSSFAVEVGGSTLPLARRAAGEVA